MVSDTLRLITLVPDNVGYILLLMPVGRTDLMYQTVSGTNMINQRMYEIILYYSSSPSTERGGMPMLALDNLR